MYDKSYLLSSESINLIPISEIFLAQISHVPQYLISDIMSESVIESLEMIDIQHAYCNRHSEFPIKGIFSFVYVFIKRIPIEKLGQLVRIRLLDKPHRAKRICHHSGHKLKKVVFDFCDIP